MTARYNWPDKDPDEVLDYQHDFTPRLDGDTIGTVVSLVDIGDVEIDETTQDDGVVTVWLSGGSTGTKCKILLRAETAGGRTLEEAISIRIKSN